MLQVQNLSVERGDRMLFRDLSFELQSGDLLQVTGANGSGKTTLLRTLMGLFEPEGGEIVWDLEAPPVFLGHQPGISHRLSVLENLRWLCQLQNIAADEQQLDEALAAVRLMGYQDTFSNQLSAGQRRRVGLALLYLSDNPCWILDEPLTALDVQGCQDIEDRIQAHLAAGGATILTSHQPLSSSVRELALS